MIFFPAASYDRYHVLFHLTSFTSQRFKFGPSKFSKMVKFDSSPGPTFHQQGVQKSQTQDFRFPTFSDKTQLGRLF